MLEYLKNAEWKPLVRPTLSATSTLDFPDPPEGYGTAANPHYVLLSPEGEVLAETGYTRDVAAFLAFLRTGK